MLEAHGEDRLPFITGRDSKQAVAATLVRGE